MVCFAYKVDLSRSPHNDSSQDPVSFFKLASSNLQTGTAEPSSLLFCDEEERLVCGHEDGSVSLWNLDTRQALTLREQT